MSVGDDDQLVEVSLKEHNSRLIKGFIFGTGFGFCSAVVCMFAVAKYVPL